MENKQNPTVLILGASGTIGSQLVKDLEDKPVNVRVTSRKQNEVEQFCSEGKDCKFLDLDDPKTFAFALAGVDRIFLLTGYTVGMLTQSKTLVDAAKKAGVSHIVHVGVFAEWDTTDAHFAWHQMIEKYIEASGMAWTHLHPNMFMEALTGAYLPKNLTFTTYWEDRRVGYIAASDIAAVAAKVLVDGPGRHASKDYWLSVESRNGKEIAELMSEVTGLKSNAKKKALKNLNCLLKIGYPKVQIVGTQAQTSTLLPKCWMEGCLICQWYKMIFRTSLADQQKQFGSIWLKIKYY